MLWEIIPAVILMLLLAVLHAASSNRLFPLQIVHKMTKKVDFSMVKWDLWANFLNPRKVSFPTWNELMKSTFRANDVSVTRSPSIVSPTRRAST